jgi:CheY-like chemotaxis protein
MPEMSGIDTLRCIKEDFPEKYARTPIIALTANEDESSEESYRNAGFTAYLSKPIDEMKLNEILNKYIP